MTHILPYLLITLKDIKFEKVPLSNRQNLRTFFDTLTASQRCSLLNRDNLMEPIEMQLSLKGKTFSQLLFGIFEM